MSTVSEGDYPFSQMSNHPPSRWISSRLAARGLAARGRSRRTGLYAEHLGIFITHPVVEGLILFTIVWSTFLIIVSGPTLVGGSLTYQLSFWTACILTPLYTLEALVKITAFGLVRSRLSYLRNPWTLLDLGLLIIQWTEFLALVAPSLVSGGVSIMFLRLLRVVRVFRHPRLRNADTLQVIHSTASTVRAALRGTVLSRPAPGEATPARPRGRFTRHMAPHKLPLNL